MTEKGMFSLVGEAKGKRGFKFSRSFTLIERVSRLSLGRCNLLKCRFYQFPIQVGSLTTNVSEQSGMLMRSDKVSEGKPFAPIDSSSGAPRGYHEEIKGKATLYPPYWQGKEADRRLTNRVGVVKVTQSSSGLIGDCEGRVPVRWAKPEISGVEMGRCTRRPCRRKSGRYVLKQLSGNWRDPNMSLREGKGRYNVESPLKFQPKHIRGSEMLILAIGQKVSKAFWSEGALAWVGFLWKRCCVIVRKGCIHAVVKVCVFRDKLTDSAKTISRMLWRKIQGESCVTKKGTHSLVGGEKVGCFFSFKKMVAFSLIERVPREALRGVV